MSGVKGFMFLVLVPALIALGHDFYLFYANQGQGDIVRNAQEEFKNNGPDSFFADLGFIWTQYEPESYKTAVEVVEPADWAKINWLLGQKAFVVGLAFAGFWYVLLGLMKILHLGPFKDSQPQKFGTKSLFRDSGKQAAFKYKRK